MQRKTRIGLVLASSVAAVGLFTGVASADLGDRLPSDGIPGDGTGTNTQDVHIYNAPAVTLCHLDGRDVVARELEKSEPEFTGYHCDQPSITRNGWALWVEP
ncbi:hypothetical protein [Allosalinactinospora lopnorensis]|uniref:hypothetical protein n=1 Tax=Allosalinactinospora lopnorensis TaxID=1352348 RepID=UPI000623CF05|nr:hypothetical protein [Allosalinactinospora lopnorensis]